MKAEVSKVMEKSKLLIEKLQVPRPKIGVKASKIYSTSGINTLEEKK